MRESCVCVCVCVCLCVCAHARVCVGAREHASATHCGSHESRTSVMASNMVKIKEMIQKESHCL